MALLKCSACSGQVDSSASSCPHCGATAFRKSSLFELIVIAIALLVFAMLGCGLYYAVTGMLNFPLRLR